MLERLQTLIPNPLPRPGRRAAVAAAVLVATGTAMWLLATHPPVQTVAPDEVVLRTNRYTGEVSRHREGTLAVLAGVHEVRRLSLRDRSWHAESLARADGRAPAQSVEGLSLGLELTVRWAVDAEQVGRGRTLPEDIGTELIEPAVQAVVYPLLARHTVREIFSTQRAEIQQQIEAGVRTRLAGQGLVLRAVQIGNVDLPADYKRGLNGLLAEGLATEKMRYTLELKDKRVKETELDAAADKVRREGAAEAAAREQVIAARAQEEAMKHVLPLKQRQVEQRQLEAEAERVARLKLAEGAAAARRIEAQGEADARQKLADAEAYRVARLGVATAEQMAREGVLLTRHPLLIQKTLADKLSDKVQVIIAPPPADGGFIGNVLLGQAAKAGEAAEASPTGEKEQ